MTIFHTLTVFGNLRDHLLIALFVLIIKFIYRLFCLFSIVKNAAENSVLSTENSDLNSKMDKNHVAKQKQLIQKYQPILQEYLASGVKKARIMKQIEAIYAMQVYANSKGFPKYFLAHLFNQMYDLEIIEEDAFLQWKDEINENYPNKGQALFYVRICHFYYCRILRGFHIYTF